MSIQIKWGQMAACTAEAEHPLGRKIRRALMQGPLQYGDLTADGVEVKCRARNFGRMLAGGVQNVPANARPGKVGRPTNTTPPS